MAAGLGFKTFNTGEVLTSADVNGYLMQGVLVFASEAARNAAITSPQEGQFAYTKDNNSLWYYTGSAWAASGATGDIEGVTAGVGISGGGTSGTVTITNDMATTITASGDIVVGTGSGTYDNLPIGSTGQVLTADTTVSPYKVKWSTPASGSTFVGVSLKKSVNQAILANTATTITFNQESFDTDGFHDNATNNSRITIPSGKGGYYAINATIDWAQNANATNRQVRILKNGTLVNLVIQQDPGNNVDAWTIQCNTVLNLAATDYIEMVGFTGSACDAQATYTTAILTYFNATYLGA